MSPVLC